MSSRPPIYDPEVEQASWKIIVLYLLMFPKYMYSSHLFHCLILEMFWVFI